MNQRDSDWQHALRNTVNNYAELCSLLNINENNIDLALRSFPLRVPRAFVARMERGNPLDPLLLQVLPQAVEMQLFPGYSQQPLEEAHYNPVPGLLHKYSHRVLMTLTPACAINCRYCFRRHFPYEENLPSRENFSHMLAYIAANKDIEEVIFSGGDPLVLKDALLMRFVSQLTDIPHLSRLRIHTRLPIVIPERLHTTLFHDLVSTRFQVVMVVHANHPSEIDESVKQALLSLKTTNISLLNQSVLLKGVNDDAKVLAALSKKLLSAGVLPYYLHLLDKVAGAAHFEVSAIKAAEIIATLKQILPGYLVPKLALEMPGMLSKHY